jgi:putative DNA primase/helicase
MSNSPFDVTKINPFELGKIIGVDPNKPRTNGQATPLADTNAREPIDMDAHPSVQDALDYPVLHKDGTVDRSETTYSVVAACGETGLGLEAARWAVDQDPKLAARVAEFLARNPPVDDVKECYERWLSLNAWAQPQPVVAGPGPSPQAAAAAPNPGPQAAAAAPSTAAAQAPTPGPGRFFGRQGLRVLQLANEVMATVTCGFGCPDKRHYVYENGVWLPDEGQIKAEITRLLRDRYRITYKSAVLDMIECAPGTARITDSPLAEFINVPNGMLDWKTGNLLPHDPDYCSTVQLPVEYVAGARCPLFEKFLAEVLPEDLWKPTKDSPHGFIWELIGYALYSGNPLHVAILLFGKGRNGKGTLIRVLKVLLGEHNCSTVSLHELVENRFRAATLFRKLANLAGDLDAKWLENTALFKKVTGGDGIQGEHKYAASFEFNPWALPIYSANKAFGSPDSSEGWAARWIVVPFPNSFLGHEDRTLDAKLSSEAELRGILARGVAALPALMARGRFAEPASLIEAKAGFITASDSVRAFVDEYFDIAPNNVVPLFLSRTKVWELYCWYAASENPKTTLSARELYNRLGQISGITPHKRHGGERGFAGIGIKSRSRP